ncbi:response regulator [Pontibacter cellulosilyticus]|uniref:Response regulator n=1 Tax=Pontibacter cellulosilyticus TaxID=1720253 RepID=A0A923N394_9BACT|nr:response regulator [Pontibacter cellulosilyticus]MBC5991431.1 response regulator [Pontibacter cellulosilyticus]
MKIFIVNDDIFSLGLYEEQIKSLGYYNISTFKSCAATLEELSNAPTIVLLDYNTADMNGFEALNQIKKQNPLIYVIMFMMEDRLDLAAMALQMGAFDSIFKDGQELQKIKEVLFQISEIQQVLYFKKPQNQSIT